MPVIWEFAGMLARALCLPVKSQLDISIFSMLSPAKPSMTTTTKKPRRLAPASRSSNYWHSGPPEKAHGQCKGFEEGYRLWPVSTVTIGFGMKRRPHGHLDRGAGPVFLLSKGKASPA